MFAALADYHVHTPLCQHATGWPAEFARRALELGLGELGFSDHNPMPARFDEWRMLREDLPRYIEEVEMARAAFPQLTIRLGLECDFLDGREPWIEELRGLADWDFFIGSVHYLPDGAEVDNPKYLSRYRDGDVDAIWQAYWETYGRAVRSGLFDFMGHPDLPKKFGYRPAGDLRRFYEPAVAALADTRTPFEINTAGWRKDSREQYPAREFLDLAYAAQVPLLINSDAHAVTELGAGFPEAVALAKSAGFTRTARFHRREISFVVLP
jgi:histidinol-phosphatase (PHP family)